jgi:cytochrome o ubiquinol oxidase subunit 2
LLVLLALAGLGLLAAAVLPGTDVALYNPKGLIAQEQFRLMMFSSSVLLAIAIPTLTLLYYFAWKYRESNQPAHQPSPPAHHGKLFTLSLWAIPTLAVVILTAVVWPTTHRLDPHKSIAADAEPLTVQVIALRWKWLFIYPQQGIATVNYVQIPTDTRVQFDLTADEAPMNSFWIPHLGGQLYAMTGHSNQLNLMATTSGSYAGQAAEINGDGFAGMKFTAQAVPKTAFDQWVQSTQQSPNALDAARYAELLKPSQNNPVAFYTTASANLYNDVLQKYADSHSGHGESQE